MLYIKTMFYSAQQMLQCINQTRVALLNWQHFLYKRKLSCMKSCKVAAFLWRRWTQERSEIKPIFIFFLEHLYHRIH